MPTVQAQITTLPYEMDPDTPTVSGFGDVEREVRAGIIAMETANPTWFGTFLADGCRKMLEDSGLGIDHLHFDGDGGWDMGARHVQRWLPLVTNAQFKAA